MANRHFGNLADVFKHITLCEVLATLRPGEYWESHAGAGVYIEDTDPPLERRHGIHHFAALQQLQDTLRLTTYGKALTAIRAGDDRRIPGSPLLARVVLGDNIRRFLLCDLDADALQNAKQMLAVPLSEKDRPLPAEKIECVPDDGISVLRGAGVLLPEKWTTSTLAFIDPYDITQPTDAGITPLELACELANRSIAVLLFYTFADAAAQQSRRREISTALEKACLTKRNTWLLEGSLRTPPTNPPLTQWGFGIMALSIRQDALELAEKRLQTLATAYEKSPTTPENPGTWQYTRTSL